MYGSESWKGLKDIEERIRRFESRCLRKIMGVKCFVQVSELEMRRRSGQRYVIERIKRKECLRKDSPNKQSNGTLKAGEEEEDPKIHGEEPNNED